MQSNRPSILSLLLLTAVLQVRNAAAATQGDCKFQMEAAKYYFAMEDAPSLFSLVKELRKARCHQQQQYDPRIKEYESFVRSVYYPSSTDLAPYAGLLSYGAQALKESGWLTGLYGDWRNPNHLLEFSGEYTAIKIKSSTTPYTQTSGTAYYTHITDSANRLRVGGSFISSSLETNPNVAVASFGFGFFGSHFDGFLDTYYSQYSLKLDSTAALSSTPTTTVLPTSRNILQLSPQIVYRLNIFGRTSLTLSSNIILPFNTSGDTEWINALQGKTYLVSSELEIKQEILPITLSASVFFGDSIFGVGGSGFSVFNSSENNKRGLRASVQGVLSRTITIKASGTFSSIEYVATNSSYTALAGMTMLLISI